LSVSSVCQSCECCCSPRDFVLCPNERRGAARYRRNPTCFVASAGHGFVVQYQQHEAMQRTLFQG
jgi:hypothetical protein